MAHYSLKRNGLVTGASSGLGYGIAMQLAVIHQANLFVVTRRSDKLKILKQEIRGARFKLLPGNIGYADMQILKASK